MKTLFRYSWPLFCITFFEVLTLLVTTPKSTLLGLLEVYGFVLLILAVGWGQVYEYRKFLRMRADIDLLRPRVKGHCTCKTVWSAYFHCDLHGAEKA